MPRRIRSTVAIGMFIAATACHAEVPGRMKPLFTRDADEIFSGACLDVVVAAAKGKLNRLDQLLADKDLANCQGASGATPLYWAIAAKKTSVVGAERLLMAGADPNHYVESGKAIVHIAVMRGDERIVRLLLKHGANPNIEDQRSGKTPLFFIQPGGYPVVAPLLDAGADPNHRENFGETAMMSMVPIGQFRAIDALLMAVRIGESRADREALSPRESNC